MNPDQNSPNRLVRTLLLASAMLSLVNATHALDLTVVINNAKSTKGNVSVAIFDSAEKWRKERLDGLLASAQATTKLVFRNLQPGTYGLTAFHDENGNGKLDSNLLGLPIERYGFSRDATGNMGPASFADAKIELTVDTELVINLR